MVSTHVDIENTEWTPGTPFYGPAAIHDGTDIVQLKILSDRRSEGSSRSSPRRFRMSMSSISKAAA